MQVKLFATLASLAPGVTPGVPFSLEIADRSTIADLIRQLNLPEKEVKLFFVNGRLQSGSCELKNEDDVGIFPPIGGG